MRYNVELLLENDNFPKDKNRTILSFLKSIYESYDEMYYKFLYESEINKVKSFTFSLYMPRCKFTREEILVPEKKIILNFSTSDMKDGIFFYNAILKSIGKIYKIKDNTITVKNINMNKEKVITTEYAIFKSMSPVVVREHKGQNKNTWYYSLKEDKGKEIFINNLRYQLLDTFGEERRLDIDEVNFQVLANKEVKVKHYGIEVLSNICKIKIQAKPYILDYIYKSGVGGNRSSGFGMLDLV